MMWLKNQIADDLLETCLYEVKDDKWEHSSTTTVGNKVDYDIDIKDIDYDLYNFPIDVTIVLYQSKKEIELRTYRGLLMLSKFNVSSEYFHDYKNAIFQKLRRLQK